jgi:predicted N-acetyltransferase YhbS
MADWTIEALSKKHERASFQCGQDSLDDFIRNRVSQYEKRKLGKTFVAVPKEGTRVIGYYTLAAGGVAFEHLPSDDSRKLPKHPVPVVLLARLAVDESVKGKRLGEALLIDSLWRLLDLSERLGIYAVMVEAVDNSASGFYRKYGFVPLLEHPLRLYLPIRTIEVAFGQ